jgi:hypothetical protein
MNKMLIVLVLAGLLIFGCTGQQPAANGTANNAAGTGNGASAASGTQQPAASGGAGAGASAGAASSGTGGPGNTGSPASGGANQAAIATYAAAMAAGIPLECTVTANGQPMTIDIKGENMYMMGQSGGQTYEMVYKGGVSYMKLSADMKAAFAQMGKNCDWLAIAANETSSSGGVSPPASADSVQAPDVAWSCVPGLFNDDKFLTPGASCSMSDLYPAAGAGAVPGY